MASPQTRLVKVEDLMIGAFVQELDRPWLDTPFLLQGFIIENDQDLAQLRATCRYVHVDPKRCVGDAAAKYPAAEAAVPATMSRAPAQDVVRATAHPGATVTRSPDTAPRGSLLRDLKSIVTETLSNQEAAVSPSASMRIHQDPAKRPVKTPPAAAPAVDLDDEPVVPPRPGGPRVIIHDDEKNRAGSLKKLVGSLRERPDVQPEVPGTRTANRTLLVVEESRVIQSAELKEAHRVHERTRELMGSVLEDIRKDRGIDVDKLNEAVDGMVESIARHPDALIWLTRLKKENSYSYDHGIDVAIYLLAFARQLGYPKPDLQALALGGMMFDVGKLRLPPGLLDKRGKLSPAEFTEVKKHVNFSIDILSGTPGITVPVLEAIAQHHERHDGSGYPQGLGGNEIGIFARMCGIVDCFEAMTSDRPYAPAMSTHQALQSLYQWKGRYFHDALVEQFMQCVGIFPVGSLVELNTGEVGIVIGQNRLRRLRPRVMVVLDPDKRAYRFPAAIDLLNDPIAFDSTTYAIKRDLPIGSFGIDAREFYLDSVT